MRSVSALHLLFAFALTLTPTIAKADKLIINSKPIGATVEINHSVVGTTPFEKDYPGGYFHRTKTAFGSRLDHSLTVRITLLGFLPKVLDLCDGPMEWKDIHGRNRGNYWIFKTAKLEIALDPTPKELRAEIATNSGRKPTSDLLQDLSLEEIVARTKPAVVYLEGLDKSGTGFFVTKTGLIATNAHVARGEESLLASMPGGLQLDAQVFYVDDSLDVALLKVEGVNFPHLTLADTSTVRPGQPVLAIGNPGEAMLFSVTKGIVSGVQEFPNAGPGTWIQTDAPINPGNSGGPLVNLQGEVIGIATSRPAAKGINGIGFALSASDLIHVLDRLAPQPTESAQKLSAPKQNTNPPTTPLAALPWEQDAAPAKAEVGIVDIPGPQEAEIGVGKPMVIVGYAPASLTLPVGLQRIVVIPPGKTSEIHWVRIVKDSRVSLYTPPTVQTSP
jgi:S1-C subfamily serine protease